MRHFPGIILLVLFLFPACGFQPGSDPGQDKKGADRGTKRKEKEDADSKGAKHRGAPLAVKNDKIYKKNGRKYLWGGKDSSMHFDITNCSLRDSNFHFGLGREKFEALVDPEYISMEKADKKYEDSTKFLATRINGVSRAYPLKVLQRHEVVNDRIGAVPVFSAYCHLADLSAIYPRVIKGDTLTFGLSGYTYYEKDEWEGKDAFVLWDRNTESLWWPLHEKAVSGKLKGAPLKVYDESTWEQIPWKKVKKDHPDAKVLEKGQAYDEEAHSYSYEG
ncbi:MAG: DUF3179 domain-containing (seleno)protein [Flavobacteriales bacterium]